MDTTVVPKDESTNAASDLSSSVIGPGKMGRSKLLAFFLGAVLFLLGVCAGALILWIHLQRQVVATVNGAPIYAPAYYHRLEVAAGTQVLQQMATEDLTIQFAQQQGAAPTAAQISAKLTKAQSQPDFTKNLSTSHQTLQDIKHSLLVSLSQQNVFTKGLAVTNSDIQAFYQANISPSNPNALYYHPAESQVAVIVTTEPAQAQAALQALASGQSFVNVARQYSKDKSAANGGVLPPIAFGHINSSRFPGLQNIIFGLNVGQQAGPVKIAGAWWIIRCIAKAPQTTMPFSQVADDCREGALLSKGLSLNGAAIQSQMKAFQQQAKIKVLLPGFQNAIQQSKE